MSKMYDVKECALKFLEGELKKRRDRLERTRGELAKAKDEVEKARCRRDDVKAAQNAKVKAAGRDKAKRERVYAKTRDSVAKANCDLRDWREEVRSAEWSIPRLERSIQALEAVAEGVRKTWMVGVKVAVKPSFPMLLKGVD